MAALAAAACAPERTATEPAVSGPATDAKGDTVLASAVGRPNVVVIMSDDQTVEATKRYANE